MPDRPLRSRFRFHSPQQKKDWWYGILKDTEGKKSPKRKWFPLGTRKESEAHAEYERLKHLFWMGEWTPWESPRPKNNYTVGQALSEFFEQYRPHVRDKSADVMASVLRLFQSHIGPEVAARSITSDHVRAWLETPRSAAGGAPSPNTLKNYLVRLSQACEWMVEEGILDKNPCDDVEPPTEGNGSTFSVLSPGELNLLIKETAASVAGDERFDRTWLLHLINFNPCAGLRMGELCAIRWQDVERLGAESDMATVHVRAYADNEVEAGADAFQPKTRGSERQVHVWPRGTRVLRRRAQESKMSPYELVFRGAKGGPLSYQYTMTAFRELAEKCGLTRRDADGEFVRRVRPHDLRHTWISWMVNEYEHEVGVRTVADMAGHEDVSMTDQYRQPDPQSARDAMLRASGKRPEGGRRPSYETVSEWLHAEPVYTPEGAKTQGTAERQ